MDYSAAHASFVVVSYALTTLCLVALCIYVLARDRALAKKVKALKDDQTS